MYLNLSNTIERSSRKSTRYSRTVREMEIRYLAYRTIREPEAFLLSFLCERRQRFLIDRGRVAPSVRNCLIRKFGFPPPTTIEKYRRTAIFGFRSFGSRTSRARNVPESV